MATKGIKATIEGISPLLMHSFPLLPIEALEKKSVEEQAELSAYQDENHKLFIPGINLQRALIAGAVFSKGKGRGSLQKQVAACVMITPDRLILANQSYIVDSRPVVIPATKGRVLRHRPRFDKWGVSFDIEYDPNLLTADQVRRILDDTGSRVGLLDFRPERKGPFGRFQVISWQA